MVSPDAGAAPLRVTVPVDAVPPVTEEGENVTDAIDNPVRLTVAFFVEDPSVAVIVSASALAIKWDVIVNVAVFAPVATVTVPG